MADIYTEQGITKTATTNIGEMSTGREVHKAAKIFDAISEHTSRQAEQHQKLANNLYEGGSNLAILDGLQQMSNDPAYASNPEAFAKEADKMASKVYGEIQNPEIKANVILNYEMRKAPYINRAYANMYRNQNEELEYQTLKGIQKNMDDVGLSIENVMDGTLSVDDLRTLSESKGNLDRFLLSKDVRGFNMFTPNQRIQIERQYNNNIVDRLKGGYLQLDVHERQKVIDMLKNDEFGVSYTDKDGITTKGDIKSILPTDSYLDFKDFVLKTHARALKMAGGDNDEITQEMQERADTQFTNSVFIGSEINNIKELKKDKPVERVLRNLELQDTIQGMGEDGLSESDAKKYKKETVKDLIESLKNEEDVFDDAWIQESAMSVALQSLKHDGKINGNAWGDDMSVVMIRDFYTMAKENNLDLRATDSSSRELSKDLAAKAISNTIERVVGGHGKEYNSIFVNGRKVSKQPIKQEEKVGYVNTDYIINNGKKKYNETGIEVDL